MSTRLSLVGLLVNQQNPIFTIANLDPTDLRTRCFKRAAATFVAERLEDRELSDLGYLRGDVNINWDLPYCATLNPELTAGISASIDQSVRAVDSAPLAVMHATHRFIAELARTEPPEVADECIRQVINGIVSLVGESLPVSP